MRKIELSEQFTKRKILLYSLPGIFDAFATASFQIVDGYFVSNLLGFTAFAAVGLISPVFFLLYALGFMFGEGASAMISQFISEENRKRGYEVFSMTIAVMLIFGAVVSLAAVRLSGRTGADADGSARCLRRRCDLVLHAPGHAAHFRAVRDIAAPGLLPKEEALVTVLWMLIIPIPRLLFRPHIPSSRPTGDCSLRRYRRYPGFHPRSKAPLQALTPWYGDPLHWC